MSASASSDSPVAPFTPTSPEQARAERVYASLFRIAERHAASNEQRQRQAHPSIIGAHEAIRLVSFLLSGAALPTDGEPAVDQTDITAALTLMPLARGEMDELEVGLLQMARGRGMTWPEIAFGLGLGTPQAARQRYERLLSRTDTDMAPAPSPAEPTPAPGTDPGPESEEAASPNKTAPAVNAAERQTAPAPHPAPQPEAEQTAAPTEPDTRPDPA